MFSHVIYKHILMRHVGWQSNTLEYNVHSPCMHVIILSAILSMLLSLGWTLNSYSFLSSHVSGPISFFCLTELPGLPLVLVHCLSCWGQFWTLLPASVSAHNVQTLWYGAMQVRAQTLGSCMPSLRKQLAVATQWRVALQLNETKDSLTKAMGKNEKRKEENAVFA